MEAAIAPTNGLKRRLGRHPRAALSGCHGCQVQGAVKAKDVKAGIPANTCQGHSQQMRQGAACGGEAS